MRIKVFLVEADEIVDYEHLAVAIAARANADDRNFEPLGHGLGGFFCDHL